MSLDDYVSAQQRNFDAIKESPHYSRLLETVDHLEQPVRVVEGRG
jgi:hypothetical protein